MKVLWYTLTPCNALTILQDNIVTCGWLQSLENVIKQNRDIELSICFLYNKKMLPFKHEGVNYYPIYKANPKNKIKALITRYTYFLWGEKENLKPLLDVITTVNPNIIHIHGSENIFGLVQQYTNIPCVLSIQSIINPYVEKFFSGIPLSEASKHERLLDKLALSSSKRKYNSFLKLAENERKIYKYTKYVMGRTDWDYRISRILSPDSYYFHGDEILRPQFYNNTWNKDSFNEKLQIVTIMSNGLYKGLDSVIKTAKILTKYGLNFKWIIIQKENDSYVKLNKSWLKEDFSTINISFLGKKKETEIINILLQSDIYCQVSHIENSPNSLCEAMLLGMPIIATMVGGTDSLLLNKHEGILVQDGDSYSMAGAIVELKENFTLSLSYGHNAQKRARNRHDPSKIANEVISTYKTIIGQ